MKKSIWRFIVGLFLLWGVSNSMRTPLSNHELSYVIVRFALSILLAAIGVWLIVSWFRRSN
jgi:cytochrome oxidase assembly protein ShyY1